MNTNIALPSPLPPREAFPSPPPSLLDLSPTNTLTAFDRNAMDAKAVRAPRRASWAPNVVIPTTSFTSGGATSTNDPAANSPVLASPPGAPPPSPASPIPTSSTSLPPPLLQETRQLKTVKLPRGGTYVATCVGPIQIGIPPETIKDCLNAGLYVPRHYIVPPQRFNRHLGSALGINVCEFEFPAYYAFFFQRQSLNLIVDSQEVEDKIRAVFQETLFGPLAIDADADFAHDYPVEKRPELLKESGYFRKFGDTFLEMNMLLRFTHFDAAGVARPRRPTVARRQCALPSLPCAAENTIFRKFCHLYYRCHHPRPPPRLRLTTMSPSTKSTPFPKRPSARCQGQPRSPASFSYGTTPCATPDP